MKRNTKYIIIGIIVLIVVGLILYFNASFSSLLENDVRVKPESDLTYYIDVIYDGKDSEVTTSSDTATAKVFSDYIYVEDKIPEGLVFKDFVSSDNIGAVKRDDGTTCIGYVSDGPKYDINTRMVSFNVKNLQAGCKLTVGVITTTPPLGENKRLDFYNTAFARERDFSTFSNTTHAFMGDEEATLHTVSYVYEGTVENAPTLPVARSYVKGTEVTVDMEPSITGYTFSGWSSSNVEIVNGKFVMPDSDVVLKGSFTKNQTYTVSYSIEGEGPESYIVPNTKNYSAKEDVLVDSLKEGDIIDGYKFLGWKSDVAFVKDPNNPNGETLSFTVPERNVNIVGKFERISYTVSYKFVGEVIPEDATSLLPAPKNYYPKDKVVVASYPVSSGYEFLGWYKESEFEMPDQDVVIVGEWRRSVNKFTLDIKSEITNYKAYFNKDEQVNIKTTITNPNNFEVKDLLVDSNLEEAVFLENNRYTILNDNHIKILSLGPLESIEIFSNYMTKNDNLKTYKNDISLTGAISQEANYILDNSVNYLSTVLFNVSNIKVSINVVNEENNNLSSSEFKLYSDTNLEDLLGTGLEFNTLIPNKTYYLKQSKVESGYVISKDILKVEINSTGELLVNDEVIESNVITIINKKINVLPNTGGIGTFIYSITGLVVVIVAVIVFLRHKKKYYKIKKRV